MKTEGMEQLFPLPLKDGYYKKENPRKDIFHAFALIY